jgi:hypothetical protein
MSDSGGAAIGPSAAKAMVETRSRSGKAKHRINMDSGREILERRKVMIMIIGHPTANA